MSILIIYPMIYVCHSRGEIPMFCFMLGTRLPGVAYVHPWHPVAMSAICVACVCGWSRHPVAVWERHVTSLAVWARLVESVHMT